MVRDAGVHHPSESPQACRTGLAPLDNLIPDQRRAQHAGQGGVAVKGGRLPPADWFSMCSSSPPEAFAERWYPLPRYAVECGKFESKRHCSDKRVNTQCGVFTFMVFCSTLTTL
jgi:hypothetical protein